MSMRAAVLLSCTVWIGAPSSGAFASSEAPTEIHELVRRAVESYGAALEIRDRGARLEGFRHAERLFAAAAAKSQPTPELQVNLGNSALAGERLGPAILAYRRALVAAPTHAQAGQNLEHARSLLPTWVPRPEPAGRLESSPLVRLFRDPAALPGLAAVCFAAASLCLAAGIRWNRAGLRLLGAVCALAWLALLAQSLWGPGGTRSRAAVVISEDAIARSADSALATLALSQPLPEGTEVQWVESRSPWARVRLANGRDVWLLESALSGVESESGPNDR